MNLLRSSVFLLFAFTAVPVIAGNVTIEGKATAYPSRKISLNTYSDYLSLSIDKIAETTIDSSGNFIFHHDFTGIREVIIRIDGVKTFFFVQPGAHYKIIFPDIEKGRIKTFHNNQVEVLFDTLLLYDINSLILDFDDLLDRFIGENYKQLGSSSFRVVLDSFQVRIGNRYREIDNPFFREYVRYSFAGIEQLGGINVDMSIVKLLIFKEYLSSGKIMYDHPKYMLFFNQFYTDVFQLASKEEEKKIFNAIQYQKSPKAISDVLIKDDFLKQDNIRELVLIKALSEVYYSGEYDQENIIAVLDSIKNYSVFAEHRKIAGNMSEILTRLNFGYRAPEFELMNPDNEQVNLKSFEGKYVYLHFWASWNSSSAGEMKLMKEMLKCYGRDISFVSVNLDESEKDWKQFLKENPGFNWAHLHYGNYPEIIELYRINSVSSFFLIGPEGKFVQSPAFKPTPDGTFRSIDQTFFEIWRKLHPAEKRPPCERK